MRSSTRVRQFRRWLSLAFTAAAVVVTLAVLTQDGPAAWVYLSPLLPLALLLFAGPYLFVLPQAAKRRIGRRPTNAA